MTANEITLETERLKLRPWRDSDLEPFAALNADPEVMRYFPKVLDRTESDAMATRIRNLMAERGWGLWAVEVKQGAPFIGFVGLNAVPEILPFAPGTEIGWRLAEAHWGKGYATEAARSILQFAFETLELEAVVSFTAEKNTPSMAVMKRLGMRHKTNFEHPAVDVGHILRPHVLFELKPGR